MNVIKLLQDDRETAYKTLDELGITVKEYDNIILLNYSQIKSPRFHPIVEECRALILDKNNFNILSRTFDRFYNYSEDPKTDEFNILNSIAFEKIDGSLIACWYNKYSNDWEFATRKMAFAEGTNQLENTFKSVVLKAIGDNKNLTLLKNLLFNYGTHYTYIFELVSPETRVTKPYSEYRLYYLGRRNIQTGYEELSNEAPHFIKQLDFIKFPQVFSFKTYEEIVKNIDDIPALDEGYVCVERRPDGSLFRLKTKNPRHTAISRMRNNGCITPKRIAYLVFENEHFEYLTIFPEDTKFFAPFIQARNLLFNDCETQYDKIKHIESQKEFALEAFKTNIPHVLLGMRKNNISYHEYFKKVYGLDTLEPKLKRFLELFKNYIDKKDIDIIENLDKQAEEE